VLPGLTSLKGGETPRELPRGASSEAVSFERTLKETVSSRVDESLKFYDIGRLVPGPGRPQGRKKGVEGSLNQ
jgi:hypothetical protein